jgi:hypothetical protein
MEERIEAGPFRGVRDAADAAEAAQAWAASGDEKLAELQKTEATIRGR